VTQEPGTVCLSLGLCINCCADKIKLLSTVKFYFDSPDVTTFAFLDVTGIFVIVSIALLLLLAYIYGHCITTPCCGYRKHCYYVRFYYPNVTTLRSGICRRNSVCRLSSSSVTFVHCTLLSRLKFSAIF